MLDLLYLRGLVVDGDEYSVDSNDEENEEREEYERKRWKRFTTIRIGRLRIG
jgi:hypothetical protein